MAVVDIIPIVDADLISPTPPLDVEFFRVGSFGCGEADDADEQGIVVDSLLLRVP